VTDFSPSSLVSTVTSHRGSPYTYITWGMNNRPVVGRSSETQSHPVFEIGRYMLVYHTGTSFAPEFNTGTYQYTPHTVIFFILTVYFVRF
jgi:hypothetical protein